MAAARIRDTAPKPRNDAYVVLLGLSLFAMLTAIALLLFDFSVYYGLTTAPPQAPSIPAQVDPTKPPTPSPADKPIEQPPPG